MVVGTEVQDKALIPLYPLADSPGSPGYHFAKAMQRPPSSWNLRLGLRTDRHLQLSPPAGGLLPIIPPAVLASCFGALQPASHATAKTACRFTFKPRHVLSLAHRIQQKLLGWAHKAPHYQTFTSTSLPTPSLPPPQLPSSLPACSPLGTRLTVSAAPCFPPAAETCLNILSLTCQVTCHNSALSSSSPDAISLTSQLFL